MNSAFHFSALSLVAAVWAGSILCSSRASAAPDFAREVKPLLENYCYGCHGKGKKKGGVTLDQFTTAEAAIQDQKTWGAVLENLRTGVMPPEEEKQPTLEEREKLEKWIDAVVFATD
ncbi:MAG: hypothetical protein M3463_17115, partial [Verrucomicrobiota bacterium]|nr:hypothetical protein [Verrucomicrobiota bacterium]